MRQLQVRQWRVLRRRSRGMQLRCALQIER